MNLISSERFIDDFDKVVGRDRKYREKIKKCLRLLVGDISHPSLRLHKIVGMGTYSISVDMKMRILIQIDSDNVHLLRVGTHDEVY